MHDLKKLKKYFISTKFTLVMYYLMENAIKQHNSIMYIISTRFESKIDILLQISIEKLYTYIYIYIYILYRILIHEISLIGFQYSWSFWIDSHSLLQFCSKRAVEIS